MTEYRLVVTINPVAGQEAEFARWYEDIHLPDVLAVPGVVAAQRFDILDGHHRKHMAIYELDCDDEKPVVAEILARAGTDAMQLSPAADLDDGFEMVVITPNGRRQFA